MTFKHFSFAAAAVAAGLMGTATAGAQNAQAQPAATSSAPVTGIPKPSPYQGISQPPANDAIVTTDDQAAQPAAAPAVVAAQPAPAITHAAAAPSPEVPANSDADDDDDADIQPAPAVRASGRERTYEISEAKLDSGVVTYVPGPANALPEGTVFDVHMMQTIDAIDATPGTEFRAKLSRDILHDGRVVVPIGSELRGKIVYVSHGRRISGPSIIHLRPEEFLLPDGTCYRLQAEVIDTRDSDTKAIREGDISTKAHGKRAVLELVIGGGGGALIGAKLGGPVGAAVGSAIGAGAIGAHLLLAQQSVDLPEESTVVFSLTNPMYLTPKASY
jgi:hypothetical protein